MKKSYLFPLLFMVLPATTGCNTNTKVTSLKEGLSYICNKKNYQIDYLNQGQPYYSHIYTSNYVGIISSYRDFTDVYYKDKGGVFSISFDRVDYQYRSSEYLSKESVWSSGLVKTMYGVEKDYVSSLKKDENEIVISNKSYKLALLETLGYQTSDIVYLNEVTASYKEDKSIDLAMTFGKTTYQYNVHSFGTAKWNELEKCLKDVGSAYKPSENESLLREKLRCNKYVRLVYDFEAEGYTYWEVFHPHYFYTKYSSGTYAGVMGLNWIGEDYPYELKGIYSWTSVNGEMSFSNICMSENPDVTVYYHYPSYLKILDSLSYLKEGKLDDIDYSVDNEGGKNKFYYIDSVELRNDFISNFSIDNAFPTDTYTPTGLAVQVSDIDTDSGMIIFYYAFTYNGDTYTMPIPLGNFGATDNDGLNTVWEYYNNR